MFTFRFTYHGFLFFTLQSKDYNDGIYKAKMQCYNDFGHDVYISVFINRHDTGKRFKYSRRGRKFERIDKLANRTRKDDLQALH